MLSRFIAIASLSLTMLFAGCATIKNTVPLTPARVALKNAPPVYLMTITVRNDFHPSFQPTLFLLRTAKMKADGTGELISYWIDAHSLDRSASNATGNSYLVSIEMDPGDYTLINLNANSFKLLVNGQFFLPLDVKMQASGSGFIYIGHIEAVVMPRKEGELRAGGIFPLIDQGAVGAINGTWEVKITDRWDIDGPKFLATYPALSGVTIQKAILPAFDRAKVQKWWEDASYGGIPKP